MIDFTEEHNMKKTILLAMIALALSACLSTNQKGLSGVRMGMSTYEVRAVAGPPDQIIPHEIPFGGKREEWIYRNNNRRAVLLFENDVLIAMSL
jgi:starvation-inducible outer membrane lipoprotein